MLQGHVITGWKGNGCIKTHLKGLQHYWLEKKAIHGCFQENLYHVLIIFTCSVCKESFCNVRCIVVLK